MMDVLLRLRQLPPQAHSRQRRTGRKIHNFISLLCVSVMKFPCAPRPRKQQFAAGIGLRAFYGTLRPMPAYAVCVSIAAIQAVSISLSVFRTRSPVKIFWSKNRLFRLCRAFMRNVKDKPGVKLFSAQPQPHCHQTVANSANGSAHASLT